MMFIVVEYLFCVRTTIKTAYSEIMFAKNNVKGEE